MRYDLIGEGIFDFRTVYKDGKWGLVKASNFDEEIVAPEWDTEPEQDQGFIIVKSKEEKYGLLYADATECLPVIYDDIKIQTSLDGTRIVVSRLDGRCAIFDKLGKELIPFTAKYSSLKYNSDNEIIAYKNGVCGIITIKQEVVLQLEYTKIYKFCDDIWYAFKGDNEGVIEVGDTRVIVPCEFKSVDRISNFFSAISHQDKVKLYDESGIEVTLPFEYDGIRWLFADKFEVTNNSFKGIISIKSEGENYIVTPITDIRYSSISKFENGFAIVTNAQKWEGFINEDGEQIGSMNFESVRPFTNDLAAVEMHRSQKTVWGFIDTSGEIVIPYIYDKVKDFKEFEYTSVCKDGKWTVIDRQGNEVIPCIYDEVTSIQYHKRQELLYVHVTLDGYEGLIEVKTAIDEE